MPREVTTDSEVLDRLVAPAHKDVLDIGCGGGALARELASRGARVVALEISAEQLAPALARAADAAEPTPTATATATGETISTTAETETTNLAAGTATAPTARYLIGTAQDIPLDDSSIDIAIFMRTLHHVPQAELMQALGEARRVLRPDGVVYVAEPLTEGDYYELTSMVEDEFEVRQAAEKAVSQAGLAGLERVTTVEYDVRLCLADVAALRARVVSVDPKRVGLFDARADEIAAAFARLGEAGERPGERCFQQPMRADVLRPAQR
ncbi:MAG TPA: class I SAM-dependent methyltransferase [Solirubrobacteraceae bacterium]|nr:class I SAM-dependent methyltransferase [Solirubrobacteraceae bacterium]